MPIPLIGVIGTMLMQSVVNAALQPAATLVGRGANRLLPAQILPVQQLVVARMRDEIDHERFLREMRETGFDTSRAEEIHCDADIDVVSIASYDNYHSDQIFAAIKNGKHVFAEKPLCLTRHEADGRLSRLPRAPGATTQEGLGW